MPVVTREETGAQRAQVAEGGRNNRAGLCAQAQGGRPVPPRSTAACPGPQQGPRPLHHAVALSAPGSPGPPPSSPVLRLGMMKPQQLRGGGADQWLGGGWGPPGDPRRAPGPLPPQRGGVRALSGLGLVGHQVVCESPADHDRATALGRRHREAMASAGRPERWLLLGAPGQLGSRSRGAADSTGLPSDLQPQRRTARSLVLGPGPPSPKAPTMAGIKWDVCGCGLRTYSPCQELGEVLRLPQRTE